MSGYRYDIGLYGMMRALQDLKGSYRDYTGTFWGIW